MSLIPEATLLEMKSSRPFVDKSRNQHIPLSSRQLYSSKTKLKSKCSTSIVLTKTMGLANPACFCSIHHGNNLFT